MAECQMCRRKGMFLTLGANGFCKQCSSSTILSRREFSSISELQNSHHESSWNQQSHHSEIKDKEAQHYIQVQCPACEKMVRIPVPPPSRSGTCSGCRSRFLVHVDQTGRVHLSKVIKKPIETGINDSLNTLGLMMGASATEIKIAYKKSLSEYHPDKTAHLGKELQQLSARKTREIIQAFEILKKNGYLEIS